MSEKLAGPTLEDLSPEGEESPYIKQVDATSLPQPNPNVDDIAGYRHLNADEIDLVNQIKAEGRQIEGLIERLHRYASLQDPPSNVVVDGRWLAIARTHLQQGLMAAVRAVTRPTGF